MCTLLAAFHVVPGHPLVVAANRDELYARPASGLARWEGEPFLAPRDEQAHGTWLGLSGGRLFVGVTNRFGVPREDHRRSRGELVVQALRAHGAEELHAQLVQLDPRRYNAFHLLYADPERAFVTWSDGRALAQHELSPGLHVVTERSLGADDHGRTERLLAEWRARVEPLLHPSGAPTAPAPVLALEELLKLHAQDPVAGTCVHVPALGYGTRSSLVLALAEPPGRTVLRWAEGHPCERPFVDRAGLLLPA